MSKDINDIIEGWDYVPGEVTVRKIIGKDGKEKIQMRLDLGLMQMEISERPDGKKPYGKESLFEYYKYLVEQHVIKYGSDENFHLNIEDCVKLQREAVQYYYRYLSLFQLEEYELAKRDTERNLRLIEFVNKYATSDEEKWLFEQYFPYIMMMNTRARATICIDRKEYKEALRIIRNGIKNIRKFFKDTDFEEDLELNPEITFLENWEKSIREIAPVPIKEKLENELKHAITNQEFEKAAKIRDKLHKLSEEEKKDENSRS